MPDRYPIRRALRKLLRPIVRRSYQPPKSIEPSDLPGPSLFLLAHPDDEVFCSGLIRYVREQGQPAHIACFTRGEGGTRGSYPDDVDLAAVREKEMEQSAEILGASSLTFLGYEDPETNDDRLESPQFDPLQLQEQLTNLMAKHDISLLVSHGSSGEYWHPAHVTLHEEAKRLAENHRDLSFWTMNAWVPDHPLDRVLNQDDIPTLKLDASSYEEERIQSLLAHQSQLEVFETFVEGSVRDYIDQTHLEAYRQVKP
ncbi:MAG: PIG-L deacetylase family protein [Verrucomicrobiota bacterium JB023]|nr:PIG-L deacetylase family protein [Verrucomicrobiota bacterium JB023]